MSDRLSVFDTLGENLASLKIYNDNKADEDREINKREILVSTIKTVAENELTDLQKEIFDMYYFNELTVKEIADILQKNKSTVYRILHAAEQRIKKYSKYFFSFLYHFKP